MTKSILLIATLAIAGMASTKTSADMIISRSATVAGQQLAAGKYLVQVNGNTATFLNMDTEKSVTATVKVANAGSKFDLTAAECKDANGNMEIKSIDLGGSTTRIEFGE